MIMGSIPSNSMTGTTVPGWQRHIIAAITARKSISKNTTASTNADTAGNKSACSQTGVLLISRLFSPLLSGMS